MKTKLKNSQLGYHIVLWLMVLFLIIPIFYAISYAFQPGSDIYGADSSVIPKSLTLENFKLLLNRLPLARITANTFLIAVCVMGFKIVTSVLAAYAFAFLNFRGKTVLYFVLISTIFIPFTVTMIPNFLTVSRFGLNDNIVGVMLPQLADATGIFLIRQAMKSIPKSLYEISRLDNIGHLRILKSIVVPIAFPSIIAAAIIFFVNAWNEYVWPSLILRSKEQYTLSLALQMFVDAEAGTEITIVMALSVIAMALPVVLYLIFQRQIMNTYAASGIKG